MRVNSVQNSQNFGMAFRVRDNGAWKLAIDFVNNPKLEEKFMNKIVAPLEKAEVDVVYDGSSVYYKHNANDYYSSIVQVGYDKYVTVPLGGPLRYSRNVYRPMNNSKLKYTKDFYETSGTNTFFPSIEAAKNIALNLSAERSGKALEAYENVQNYKVPDTGKTLQEKIKKLSELFGID